MRNTVLAVAALVLLLSSCAGGQTRTQSPTQSRTPTADTPAKPEREGRVLTGHSSGVTGLAFSPDGSLIATTSFDGTLRLWRASDGSPVRSHTANLRRGEGLLSVAFSPDGQFVAFGNSQLFRSALRVEDLSRTNVPARLSLSHFGPVTSVAFSPDGKLIASSGRDRIQVCSLDPSGLREHRVHPTGQVKEVAFSPDSSLLASAGSDGLVRLWRVSDGVRHIRTINAHQGGTSGVAFSPDAQLLASAGSDGAVRLWRVSDGALLHAMTGHEGKNGVISVAFHPGGTLLASGGWDRTVRLWNVSDGSHIRTLQVHSQLVRRVAFSPDGRWLASSSADGTARVIELKPDDIPPVPEPVVHPALDITQPPAHRPMRAIERGHANDHPKAMTIEQFLDGPMTEWVKTLNPPMVGGIPKLQGWEALGNAHDFGPIGGGLGLRSQYVMRDGQRVAEGNAERYIVETGEIDSFGAMRDGQRHGVWIFSRTSASVVSVAGLLEGQRTGPAASFAHAREGAMSERAHLVNGRYDGLRYQYEGGRELLRSVTHYEQGKSRRQDVFEDSGQLALRLEYDEEGQVLPERWVWIEGANALAQILHRLEGKLQGWQTIYRDGVRFADTWYEQDVQTGPIVSYAFHAGEGYISESGRMVEGKKEGVWTGFNANGDKTFETPYEQGDKHGIERHFHPDGSVRQEMNWVRGQREGVTTGYRPDGTKTSESHWEQGAQHGVARVWWPDGSLRDETHWVRGRREGAYREYAEDGTLIHEAHYAQNRLHGPHMRVTVAHEQSWGLQLEAGKIEGEYTHGNRSGEWHYYRTDGTVQAIEKPGIRSEWSLYDANGKLTQQGPVVVASKTGEWKTFNAAGELVATDTYGPSGGRVTGYARRIEPLAEVPEGVTLDPAARNGLWEFYVGDDVLLRRAVMLNGANHGRVERFYGDGKPQSVGDEYHGKREGEWKDFHPSGHQLSQMTYRDGQMQGEVRTWYEDGKQRAVTHFVDHKQHGTRILYHPDGETVESRSEFHEGAQVGEYRSWYADGTLRMEAAYANGQRHGEFRVWFEDGKMQLEGEYTDGQMTGAWKEWHPNGQLMFEGGFERTGQRLGLCKQWHDNGQQSYEATYENGRRVGVMKEWNTEGILIKEHHHSETGSMEGPWREWYEDGTLKLEGTHKAGARDGLWKEWYADGTPKVEGTHKNGARDGLWKEWYENGNPKFEQTHKATTGIRSELVGFAKEWAENGTLVKEVYYENGILSGPYRTWHENGQAREDGRYTSGRRDGFWRVLRADGTLFQEITYDGSQPGGSSRIERAWYPDGKQQWYERSYDRRGRATGLWREWNADGTLKSEERKGPDLEMPTEQPPNQDD